MSHTIMLIPTGTDVGLTSVILGVIRALTYKNIRIGVFKAIAQPRASVDDISDQTITIVRKNFNLPAAEPLKMSYVKFMLSSNKKDILMEEIVANYYTLNHDVEIILVEGLVLTDKYQFAQSLNFEIAKVLNAEIIFVMSHNINTINQLKERIELTINSFTGIKNSNISGIIVNKINSPVDKQQYIWPDLSEFFNGSSKVDRVQVDLDKLQNFSPLPVLGAIPWNPELIATRAVDIARYLSASVINEGDINTRRIKFITFCENRISHLMNHLHSNSLLVISADHLDMLIAACLAAMNDLKIGAVLLTGSYKLNDCIKELCKCTFATGLPVFMVNTNIWQTSIVLHSFNSEVPVDDCERISMIQDYIASHISTSWIESLAAPSKPTNYYLSPPAFRYRITELARKADKCIVLPEGNEPRTIKAATICAERGIATCVLLGNPDEINYIAASQNIKLSTNTKIIDPKVVYKNYITRLVELRKDKGITVAIAHEQIQDNVVLGTLMLEQNEVDGLVSGAVHTTANTIRPSLQLIKTAPGNSLVSSVFFMLLPEQVYVYGDCAINPNPNAEQLAEIAIQSAESAIAFGIEPRVAMLSYSTGSSGAGSDVDKVRKATHIAQKKRPDLIIDGPLQYDAAVTAEVAKLKAPYSPVAGRATVFIFPDLNTGNTTYKAVQRTANLVSIGPMLQGMRKPVNDLSRGALIDDIVYTIALTAIQSSQQ